MNCICGTELEFKQTVLEFVHAPIETAKQLIEGWVCPKCGERYIPGSIACIAHKKAFQNEDAND